MVANGSSGIGAALEEAADRLCRGRKRVYQLSILSAHNSSGWAKALWREASYSEIWDACIGSVSP